MEEMMLLMHTDFPDPVAPATNRCGMDAKSPITVRPYTSFPSASGIFFLGNKSRILQKFPQGNGYLLPVDNFNTYRILARNGGHDVHAFRLGRQRNILRILVKVFTRTPRAGYTS